MNRYIVYIFFISALIIMGCSQQPQAEGQDNISGMTDEENNTDGDMSNNSLFTLDIDNKHFTLVPGTIFVYEGETEEGRERIEVYVTDETKIVMGVETRIVWDRVWLDDELIEDTKDWYAQDSEGNVWYFGEETAEYENGEIVTRAGSWEAGIDGAQPGIIMKANPKVGESYQQEYYEGEAEDMADIISINETITVPYGTFDDCIKTLDYTPLEPEVQEHKYYCPGVGGVALEVNLNAGEKIELINIQNDTSS